MELTEYGKSLLYVLLLLTFCHLHKSIVGRHFWTAVKHGCYIQGITKVAMTALLLLLFFLLHII